MNHWWHVPLYVSARGLTHLRHPVPATECFEIEFDFVDHELRSCAPATAQRSPFAAASRRPSPTSTPRFMAAPHAARRRRSRIWTMPSEVADPIPFDLDTRARLLRPETRQRFWRVLVQADQVLQEFRGRLHRQDQPGAFLLGQLRPGGDALLRPPRAASAPGADAITREAYSHEVISVGFWPGDGDPGEAAFYCLRRARARRIWGGEVRPAAAFFDTRVGEFLLKYDDVRAGRSPRGRRVSLNMMCG